MKWSFTLCTLLLTLLLAQPLMSQSTCEYTLIMIDDWGDSWNGASLTITAGGTSTAYTLNGIDDDGVSATVTIPVTDGDSIILSYISGLFPDEPEYTLLDANGNIVFQDGQMATEPQNGVVYEDTISCPSCPISLELANTVEVEDIRAFTAGLSWLPGDPEAEYLIEYDTSGFSSGAGSNFRTAIGATTTLFNLEENTVYDFYISALCENGDTSIALGPFSFQTLFATDVGITEAFSPITGCALGASETISVAISNFGGVPQTLIPFDYSVNGIPAGVRMPEDGFFTGVIGTDSTETTEFDATYNFSEYGEYILQVWTALEGDSVPENDTLTINITNIPIITAYPYFEGVEEWGGGWTVESIGDGQPSWEYGTPEGNLISTAATGSGAWVTNLSGTYNNNEDTYLVSPCLDFSALPEDPFISFSAFFDIEEAVDRAWLEASTDNGETWSLVGTMNSGINWYNVEIVSNTSAWWDRDGGVPGWHYTRHRLDGTAGSSDVRLRFVFSSDISRTREGFGLDNILISLPLGRDVAASSVGVQPTTNCGSPADTIVMTVVNPGTQPAGGFTVSYSINGAPPVVDTLTDVLLLPGQSYGHTFSGTFDSTVPGEYVIQAWVAFENDEILLNDTITTLYRPVAIPPLREDFETGGLAPGWSASPEVLIEQGHNSPSVVAFTNLYSANPFLQLTTIPVGPIQEDDTLAFDYRFVDYFSGQDFTILTVQDSLIVEFSIDCGESFFPALVINGLNHTPSTDMTTVELPLGGLAGEIVIARFTGIWGDGDYYLDLDNINVRRCPESLQLTAELAPPSSPDATDGAITATAGDPSGPFSYLWSTGETTKTITGLSEGVYSVTVSNVYGCSETLEVSLFTSSVRTPANIGSATLAPNPTAGTSILNVEFTRPVDARIQLFNAIGQLLFEAEEQQVSSGAYELQLGQHDPGLYLVRILAGGEAQTLKLIRGR